MAPTQSRRSYTAGFKLKVIAFAEQNGGNMAAERKFGVTEKVIRDWRKQKDALQQTKKSRKSFRGRVAKKSLIPEESLDKFVVVKRKAARGVNIVHDFQSTEAPKQEAEWNFQSEVPEREPKCDFHHAKSPEMEPIWVLQSLNSLEMCPNCDFQSAEVKEREPISDLQTAVSLKKEPNWDFQSIEAQETENNLPAVFQSVEAQKRPISQVGNKGTKIPTKKSRKSYTAGFKLEVIAFAEKNGGNMAAERKFGVREKVIRDWRKQKTALQQTKKSKKSFRGHTAQWPDLEDKLEEYVIEQRAASRDLSAIKIRLKAREIAKEMQIHNFEGNVSWCFRFMRRKNIVLRQRRNHSKEKDVLQQTNSSCESFQESVTVAKRQGLEGKLGNLEKFVVINTEAASSYTNTVQEFQSAEAPKMEPDWEVRLAEAPEMEANCDIQSTEAQKMEPILDLQSIDSLERDLINCDLQSAEALKREPDAGWDVQLVMAPKLEPNYVVQSTETQKMEPVLNLQSNDSLEKDNNCEFQNKDKKIPTMKTRKSYTAGFKLNVIAFAEENGGNRAAERKFGVTEKAIRGWRKQKTALQQTKKSKKSIRGHAAQWPDLEDKLEEYVIEQRAASRDLSAIKIRLKAREMAKEMQIHNFEGSASWCFHFMRRKNIVLRQCRNHSKEKDVLQQTNSSCESFQGSVTVAKRQGLEGKLGNLEKFVVVNTEAVSSYTDTVQEFQSAEAPKMEPDWEVWLAEAPEMEPNCDIQSTEAQKMEPFLDLQLNDSLERDLMNCDLQSAEALKREHDSGWDVQLVKAPKMEPNYVVQSTERQKLEPALDLQSNDSLERDNNCEFQNAETPERVHIWGLQSIDLPENEPNCGFQSVVTEAPQRKSARDFQTAVEPEIEPKRDYRSTKEQNGTPKSQVGNKDQKTPTMKTRKSYTAGFKLNVIAFVEENGGNRAAERKFGVTEKAIRGWRKQKTVLQQTKKSKKSFRGLAAQWPDLEDKLEEYVIEQRAASRDLSGIKIRLKAREMAREMQIHNFEGSASWCFRFMRRKNIVLRQCRNHSKKKDVLQQTNSSCESFQEGVAKRQALEENLEKFVVVNTEAASSYTDTVQEFQSAEAQKMEPDWDIWLAEAPEMEAYCDIQSNEAQKKELILDLQSNDSLERENSCEFQNVETPDRVHIWDLQSSIDSPESEPNCGFQSIVTEAPQRKSARDFQTAVEPKIEPKRDFPKSQLGNRDQKTPTMKTRKSYTAGFKLNVIAFAEENGGNRAAERKFGVAEKAIRGWRKQKTALQQTKKSKKCFRGHTAQWPDLEDKLEEYVIEQRAASRDLSAIKIRLKAREMAKEMQIHNFEGSASWCFRFMRRKNIVLRQRKNHSKDLSIQSIDLPESEPNCGFQSIVTEAPQRESARDFQTSVEPEIEPKRDFDSTEKQKGTSKSQVGNKDQKTTTVKTRKSYTAGFNSEVIAFAEENGGNMAAERKFGVSEKNIRGWRKQKTALQQTKKSKKSFRGHAAQWPDLEDKLEKYVIEQRVASRDLSAIKIRLKAKEMAKEMQIHNFDGNASWCFRFMRRKNIVLRQRRNHSKDLSVQSIDSPENEPNCGFQSVVTEAPQRKSARDFQTAVEPEIEPKRDFRSTEEQKGTPKSQVGNKDQKTPTMKTRKSYTAGFKSEVIAFAEENGGNMAAERKFGVSEKNIRDWRKQKTALQQTKKSKKSFRGHAAQWPDLEDKLEKYVMEQRAANRDLNGVKIRLKAKEMAKEMQIHNFDGNASWCFRFMKRKNIVLRRRKILSNDPEVSP